MRSISCGLATTEAMKTRLLEDVRSEEHTSELQSHRDLHSFPTRRSSDLVGWKYTARYYALSYEVNKLWPGNDGSDEDETLGGRGYVEELRQSVAIDSKL